MSKLSKKIISEQRTFNTDTAKGMYDAEAYQNILYRKYDNVKVENVGFDKVRITGKNKR
jgi:arginyl-tRNA--protein-N-Asp/Glu arginylyltransferase